jgi:hypothetical protein
MSIVLSLTYDQYISCASFARVILENNMEVNSEVFDSIDKYNMDRFGNKYDNQIKDSELVGLFR